MPGQFVSGSHHISQHRSRVGITLGRVADNGVLSGDMGKATEIGRVGELVLTGFEPLVATGEDVEGVSNFNRTHGDLEQSDDYVCAGQGMAQNLRLAPGIGTAGPIDDPERKPVIGERRKARGRECPVARHSHHRAGAIVGCKDDTAQAKMKILREHGIHVVESPAEIGKKIAEVLKK